MKVLVVLSAVVALAAAQYLPYNSGYNWANGYGYNAAAYGLNLRSYAPTQYNYGYTPVQYNSGYAPYNYGSQFHAQDDFGGYQYGYADGLSTKSEHRRADGSTAGQYSYVDSNGQTQSVSYTAGANGFQVEGTNLPVAPVATQAPVQDTPEVQAARAEFMRAFHAAASRQRRSAPQPVAETPEVLAARAQHARLYAASAAAAAVGATPVATYLADTPEVAAEKARFFAAFNTAQARTALPVGAVNYPGLAYNTAAFPTPYTGNNNFFGYNGFNGFNAFNRFFY